MEEEEESVCGGNSEVEEEEEREYGVNEEVEEEEYNPPLPSSTCKCSDSCCIEGTFTFFPCRFNAFLSLFAVLLKRCSAFLGSMR